MRMAGHTFMKKPYLIPVVGFIGYLTLEWIHFILYSMLALDVTKYTLDYYGFMNLIYPYLLIVFQFLLIIGFLIFYIESKRKFALVVLLFGIISISLPILLNGYGYFSLYYFFELEVYQYYGLY